MKKSDLKDDMVVELRSGEKLKWPVVNGIYYDQNLNWLYRNDFDIMKVYELKEVWTRPEELKLKLSEEEIKVLEAIKVLYPEYKWITREKHNQLFIYEEKPIKTETCWISDSDLYLINFNILPFIKWEDEEPYNIDELLKGVK